jgi:hypothetical protein
MQFKLYPSGQVGRIGLGARRGTPLGERWKPGSFLEHEVGRFEKKRQKSPEIGNIHGRCMYPIIWRVSNFAGTSSPLTAPASLPYARSKAHVDLTD